MNKTTVKQQWLWQFEWLVVKACPAHAGRIDWNTAIHLFNIKMRADEAAQRYIASVALTSK